VPAFLDSEIEDPELMSSAAAEIYRMRRSRDKHLPKELTGEPAWDILLALYAEAPAKLPVSSVCFGSGAPQTTAIRWIGILEKSGLVERTQHPRDTRMVMLSLTGRGKLLLERTLKAMLRAARV
jgi:DNA-binding MarR family transcriptional regulator